MKNGLRRIAFSLLLLSAAQPAWALGNGIVEEGFAMVAGGPVLLLLLWGLVVTAKDTKATPASQRQLVIVAVLGLLFNGLWLLLLYVFDPHTFGHGHGWGDAGFVVRYVLPNAVLVAFLLGRRLPHRAAAVAASCLVAGVFYWLR
ncbi:hypothetical protein [Hymenobacter sp. HDW8]|uniref:hypothetical protein n=1 Tax=Hymenobacter sp. HDW8 TaxID=2714932 RepID=UPI001408E7AE|nr:hypothetical protein [Hymenobacter sp. HDW8]QIL78452.1 hypothetical protein G7064_21770 [Hymenobacter sp. HDW8]